MMSQIRMKCDITLMLPKWFQNKEGSRSPTAFLKISFQTLLRIIRSERRGSHEGTTFTHRCRAKKQGNLMHLLFMAIEALSHPC